MSQQNTSPQAEPDRLGPETVHYLKTVLGIESIMVPFQEPIALQASHRLTGDASTSRYHVLVATEHAELPLDGEAGELAVKMLQAMKVPLGEVAILEWTAAGNGVPSEVLAHVTSAKQILVMGSVAAISFAEKKLALGEFSPWRERKIFATYSPSDLLKAPELKKVAWAHLQTFMKVL